MLFKILLFIDCKIEIKKSPKSSELVTGIMVHSGSEILFMNFSLLEPNRFTNSLYTLLAYSERFNQTNTIKLLLQVELYLTDFSVSELPKNPQFEELRARKGL